MIILHASASDGRLVFWGETSLEQPGKPARKAVRRNGEFRVRPSRFALDEERLAETLADLVDGFKVAKSQRQQWTTWLPSSERGALPSSPLLCDEPEEPGQVSLGPWKTPAVVPSDDQGVAALIAVMDCTTCGPGVVVGKSLAYWASVLRFAGALVARQQYLPGLRASADGQGSLAHWEPVLIGQDRLEGERLARSMPHACRALSQNEADPPQTAASAVFAPVVTEFVDHLVRTAAPRGGKDARQFVSTHDQWTAALRSDSGRMDADAGEVARLAEQVRQWRRPIEVAATAPFRLCVRLEEPKPGAPRKHDQWRVGYLLQAMDDPSLLVPVKAAWKARGREAVVLNRDGFEPREYLLSALGQAATICPRIEQSLKSAAPAGYIVDSRGAHEFLSERAAALEQAGFGVFLPSWWSRKGSNLRLAARAVVSTPAPKMKSKSMMSLDSILSFRWEVSIGDEKLTYEELQALAELKSPLVNIRGKWVTLSAAEINAALEFWNKKGESSISAREALKMALGGEEPPGSLAFAGVESSGWLSDLLKQLEGASGFEMLEPPEGLEGTLRPYQSRGFSWLDFLRRWGFGACLADDMGLGKTIQTLALVQRQWESRPARERKPTLLICPMSVVGNWQKEAAKFTPGLPVMVHHGLDRARGADFKKRAAKHALVLSSYSLLHREIGLLKQVSWASLVLDEAQNIKNPQTKQAQAARSIPVEHRVALTGTPAENHVGDLWSIIEFLNPGWLGSQKEFKRTFHTPIQTGADPGAAARLKRLTGPFILRRLEDGQDHHRRSSREDGNEGLLQPDQRASVAL